MRKVLEYGTEAYWEEIGILRTFFKWDFDPAVVRRVTDGDGKLIAIWFKRNNEVDYERAL